MACGPGCECGGRCGRFGGYASPRLEQVLESYIRRKLSAGEPFYITRELNSERLRARGLGGFGFFAEIAAALASAAGSISSVVGPAAEVASVVHSVTGGGGGSSSGSSVTPDQIATAVLPQVEAKLKADGVSLPSDLAHQAVTASILDAFGPQYRPLVIAGAVILGFAVLLKLMRR